MAFPPDAMGKWGEDMSQSTENIDYDGWRFICQRYMGAWTAAALSILAFFSPILMVIVLTFFSIQLKRFLKLKLTQAIASKEASVETADGLYHF